MAWYAEVKGIGVAVKSWATFGQISVNLPRFMTITQSLPSTVLQLLPNFRFLTSGQFSASA